MPSKLRKVRFWTGKKSLKWGLGWNWHQQDAWKIFTYIHTCLHLQMSFRIFELLLAQFTSQPVFTPRNLTSFTNNFTKWQIIESLVFSICFPTSEYIPQIPNFPCENSRKIGSLLSVFLHFIYQDGSAHSLFPREIVVVLHKGRADRLAEISFRANGISSAWLLIQTQQKF